MLGPSTLLALKKQLLWQATSLKKKVRDFKKKIVFVSLEFVRIVAPWEKHV
jgi:hypothetical protein